MFPEIQLSTDRAADAAGITDTLVRSAPGDDRSPIYLSAPDVGLAEEQALVRALRSGWVAPRGPELDAFEHELAASAEREHAVALSSGTAALHLGLLALGVGPGDTVLTSTLTFAATINAIIYTGARPVLVDCDQSGCTTPAQFEAAMIDLSAKGVDVAAIVPVDLLGRMADHAAISALAARWNASVLVDAAEAFGARRDGRPAGSSGHASAISFNGNKVMTTSGGGALLTDDARIADHARYLSTQARQPCTHYEHTEVGYNYRMSNLLAALGRAQLSRLPQMIERRRRIRCRYVEFLDPVDGVDVIGSDGGECDGPDRENYWLTSIIVEPDRAGWTAEDLRRWLADDRIEARPLWKPMHAQPVFSGLTSYLDGTADRLYRNGLSLPSGSSLDDLAIDRILASIGQFLRARDDHAG
ncbi:DegT/DnrJ/EryC1/StrS family aminotransferase [Microlunatus ginsengisoli]|uniref:Aminotransferase class I/II-fold pyridoxal phosphate-dependent enzyme n=1 Tax=Microlunatus ginsengisoli TaxID=363863 RepID=A0ABP6ZEX4_9ACTN